VPNQRDDEFPCFVSVMLHLINFGQYKLSSHGKRLIDLTTAKLVINLKLFWNGNKQRLYIFLQFVILEWFSGISDYNYNKPVYSITLW
jgi:hypothetical protein